MFSPTELGGFFGKNQKSFEFGKIGNYEEKVFLRKKRFHVFESLLHKNEKAENMPVVTGRLVMY